MNMFVLTVSIFWPFPFTAPSLDSVPPVSVHVFNSENPRHHSQHYTSDVHTTPALQHLPVPPQPALASRLPPNEARDQPRKNLPIPAQVSSSTMRMVDEPPQKPPARASVVHQPQVPQTQPQVPKTQPQVPTSGDIEWDVWPDGHIVRVYSCEESKRPEVNDFHVHWACEGVGAPHKQHRGSLDALEWQDGVRTRRRCNGVIVCANHESKGGSCAIIIRPTTTKKLIAKQLETSCSCGAMLVHTNCGIIYDLFKFSDGVCFVHRGFHHHIRPP
ncbi:hypothetical protein F4604DRAFT_2044538 [Suillus subluteus]|nr:hypothetical protein F4604DRAFT_2044538 [Suillus subluteus]